MSSAAVAAGRLPAPEAAAFNQVGDQEALLLAAVPGTNLAILAKRLRPAKLPECSPPALRTFHSANPCGCPFWAYLPGESLVHGDACLPNIRCRGDGALNGYTDLGEMGAGDIEADLAAALWSLQHNPGGPR